MTGMPITVDELRERIKNDPAWPTLSERMKAFLPDYSVIGGGWVLSKILHFDTDDIDIFVPSRGGVKRDIFEIHNIAIQFFGEQLYPKPHYDCIFGIFEGDVGIGKKIQLIFKSDSEIKFDISACEIFVDACLNIYGKGIDNFYIGGGYGQYESYSYTRVKKYVERGIPLKKNTKVFFSDLDGYTDDDTIGLLIAINGIEHFDIEEILNAKLPEHEIKFV